MRAANARLGRILRAGGSALARDLGQALYPDLCWLCRAAPSVDGFGCAEHALAGAGFDLGEARCAGCLLVLPAGIREGPCARCRRRPRGYRRLIAIGPYRAEGALRAWILAFKHGGRRELAQPLARLLARAVRAAEIVGDGAPLVPVPLHPLRRLERGHDQARELAEELAAVLGGACVAALRRARWTAPQGAPGARSRTANVDGAFEPVRPLVGRAVWLVDDVVTSGATVRACAAALRRAGAAEVGVLALARVGAPDEDGTRADDGT